MTAAFDPAAWLAEFAAADGWWLCCEGKLHVGWSPDNEDRALRARAMWNGLRSDREKLAAVIAYA